jgi:hypothetical protein
MMSSCAVLGLIVFFAGRANQGDEGGKDEGEPDRRKRKKAE